jgi:putative metallopeptidase
MRRRSRKPPKPKAVSYELVERNSIVGRPMYALLDELVAAHHKELEQARVALAWNTGWKADVDGNLTLGRMKLASDLDRELTDFDLVILLNRSFYTDMRVTELTRRALLDECLCHGTLKYDQRGEPAEDVRGRRVYRRCKPDIVTFTVIAERYGLWTGKLEALAKALDRARHRNTDYWIGVGALQQLLERVGLTVPAETIQVWSQEERQQAEEWARLREELQRLPGVAADATPPSHLVALLNPELPLTEEVAPPEPANA